MKNIKGLKSLKVAGLAMLVSLGLVGCSQQQVDSNVNKLVDEAIGDTLEYELTYDNTKGYLLKVDSDIKVKDTSDNHFAEGMALTILSQCISDNTNKAVEVDSNNGFLVSTNPLSNNDKNKDLTEKANKFLVESNLFEKFYSVNASYANNSYLFTIFAPVDKSNESIDSIAKHLYSISSNSATIIVSSTEGDYEYNPNNKSENKQETKVSEPKKSTSKGSIDVAGMEKYLQAGLEDSLQSSNFKISKEVEKDYLAITVTLQDPTYAEYEDFDLAKIGDNMANEGLRDLTFNAYKEYVKSDKANFFFTLEDSTGRTMYHTNF